MTTSGTLPSNTMLAMNPAETFSGKCLTMWQTNVRRHRFIRAPFWVVPFALSCSQLACTHSQQISLTPQARASGGTFRSGLAESEACTQVGVRLAVVSRTEQPDRSLHYQFGEVEDALCTEEKVQKAKR